MTVSTTHVKNDFTGDGVTTVFNFTFQIQKVTDLFVQKAGVTQATNLYTVAINADQENSPGGTVTMTSAPANGVILTVQRSTPLTQSVGFSLESQLNAKSLEQIIDKLTLLLQEAKASTQGQTGPQGPQGPQGVAGSMTGPGSATDGALAVFNGTSGSVLKAGPAPGSDGNILKVVAGAWASAAAAASIPSGTVAFWPFDPATVPIPTGWAICNGSSVTINGVSRTTPDSRGKYLLCASTAAMDSGSSGYTGSTVRPGTVSGVKNHAHGQGGVVTIGATVSGGTVTLTNAGGFASGFAGSAALPAAYALSMNAHAHSASISGNTQSSNDTDRPIECALLMIIKVDE